QPAASSVSRDDLAQLEARFKAELTQIRSSSNTATPVVTRGSDEALIAKVKTLLEQSEENQRRDFTVRMVDLAGNIETQRRGDLVRGQQHIDAERGGRGRHSP